MSKQYHDFIGAPSGTPKIFTVICILLLIIIPTSFYLMRLDPPSLEDLRSQIQLELDKDPSRRNWIPILKIANDHPEGLKLFETMLIEHWQPILRKEHRHLKSLTLPEDPLARRFVTEYINTIDALLAETNHEKFLLLMQVRARLSAGAEQFMQNNSIQ